MVALSHGAVYVFDGNIDEIALIQAVTQCVSRYLHILYDTISLTALSFNSV